MQVRTEFVVSHNKDTKASRRYVNNVTHGDNVEFCIDQERARLKAVGYTSVRLQRHEIVRGYDVRMVKAAVAYANHIYKCDNEVSKGLMIHIAARKNYDQSAKDFLEFRKAVAREFHFQFEAERKAS
jgi:hypothetical protein